MTTSTDNEASVGGIRIKKSKPASIRFLFAHPAHFIACGFGSGLSPVASGTMGTLFGWASFLLIRPLFTETQLFYFLALAFVIGIYVCDLTGRHLGEADHGSIVWDEIVPFWIVLAFCPFDWRWYTAAFFLFRFFDIVKPPPARFFDTRLKNGFGVMMDDLVAALYTLVVLGIAKWGIDLAPTLFQNS